MCKFKVGDYVEVTKISVLNIGNIEIGMKGYVIHVSEDNITVNFVDDCLDYHKCIYNRENNILYCFQLSADNLKQTTEYPLTLKDIAKPENEDKQYIANNGEIIKIDYEGNIIGLKFKEDIDWSKIAVDTPILVKDDPNNKWHKEHFARYEDGKIYTWSFGATSWSVEDDNNYTMSWNFAKLPNK